MSQLKEKNKYVVLSRQSAKELKKIDLRLLRKEISRRWQGEDAVGEIRSQRKR